MPRLSKRFVKSLEDLACDPKLDPEVRKEVAELLVRLYTSGPRIVAATRKNKPKTNESLERLIEEL